MPVEFHGLSVVTAPGLVMTPRPASEKLVDTAVALIGNRPARVVDVGTGSGAIAIAIATSLPHVEVLATDTSPAAVVLARLNAARLSVAGRVSVFEGDLLEPVSGPVDLIVSNLPYLPVRDARHRKELAGEPPDALFSAGDGLDLYRRLIAASREQLTSEGSLVIQLYGEVVEARREELARLGRSIGVLTPWQRRGRSPATSTSEDARAVDSLTRRLGFGRPRPRRKPRTAQLKAPQCP